MDEPRRVPIVDKRASASPSSSTDAAAPPAAREPAPTGSDASPSGLGVDDPHWTTSAPPAPSAGTAAAGADAGVAGGGDAPDFPEVVGEAVGPSVAEGEVEKQDFLDDLRRLQADFDNYRKRMMREQAATAGRATARVLESLLPVLDNLERALEHDQGDGGVELVYKELKTVLEAQGLEEIPAEGVPFDPHVHEAVDSREDPEVDQIVCRSVYRRGYKLGDQVLRAAMVVVARPVEAAGAEAAVPAEATEE